VAEAEHAGQAALEAETRALKAANEDQAAELAKLRAALKAYEAEDVDERTVKESKIAMRARLSALQAQAEEQTATIQRLRAEMAAANEKLARQAAHFMDEMRRLGAGTLPPAGAGRRDGYETPQKRSLVERISAPRAPRALRGGSADAAASAKREKTEDPARVNGFLRALDGASEEGATGETAAVPAAEPATAAADTQPAKGKDRRAGLLERITRMEKPAASGG